MVASVGDTRRLSGRARLMIWGGAAMLMAVPVIAMRVSEQVAWEPGDFLFLAILVILMGAALEGAARVSERKAYLAGVTLALFTAAVQIWINLAVGIAGSEDNRINLIYLAVVLVAALGALIANFSARGMASAMVATAVAQVAAFVVVLASGQGFTGPITIFFCALWLIAAWLFGRAAQ